MGSSAGSIPTTVLDKSARRSAGGERGAGGEGRSSSSWCVRRSTSSSVEALTYGGRDGCGSKGIGLAEGGRMVRGGAVERRRDA